MKMAEMYYENVSRILCIVIGKIVQLTLIWFVCLFLGKKFAKNNLQIRICSTFIRLIYFFISIFYLVRNNV